MANITNISFVHQGKTIEIPTNKIPTISLSTMAVMKGFEFPQLDNDDENEVASWKKTATTLEDATRKWQDAKDHKTRNTIFACLRAALAVAIVVGAVLGSIALAATPAGWAIALVGMGALFLTVGLSGYSAHRVGLDFGDDMVGAAPHVMFGAILAPALALYEAFGNVSKLEKIKVSKQNELGKSFAKFAKIFGKNIDQSKAKLEAEIEQTRTALGALDKLLRSTSKEEEEFVFKIHKYSEALTEINDAQSFVLNNS